MIKMILMRKKTLPMNVMGFRPRSSFSGPSPNGPSPNGPTPNGPTTQDALLRQMDLCASPFHVEMIHGTVIKLGLVHHEATIRRLCDRYFRVALQTQAADDVFHELLRPYPPEKQLMMMYHLCFDHDDALVGDHGWEIVQKLHLQVRVLGLERTDLHGGMLMSLYIRLANRPDLAVQIFSRRRRPGYAAWRNLIYAYAQFDPKKGIAAFGEMEKTAIKPTPRSFRAVLYAHAMTTDTEIEEAFEVLVKMKKEYKMQPDVTHFGCCMYKMINHGDIGAAIQLASRIKCHISMEMCGMVFGHCAAFSDLASAQKMIDVLVGKGGTYVVDEWMYRRLSEEGLKFPKCVTVKCGSGKPTGWYLRID